VPGRRQPSFCRSSDEMWNLGEKQAALELLRRAIGLAKAATSTLEDAGRLRSRPSEMGKYVGGHRGCPSNRSRRSSVERVLRELQKPSAVWLARQVFSCKPFLP